MIEPKIDFEMLARISRRSLGMYDLTERERRVADIIIEWSFGRGRPAAVIPELDAFVDLTGLDRGDVSRALTLLMTRRIVQRRGGRDARCYEFLPSASFWNETKPLFDPERAALRAAELDRANAQLRFGDPVEAPDLDDGMAMASRETALDEEDRSGLSQIGESPMAAGIGESPTTAGIGVSPISAGDARVRARDVTKRVQTQRYETWPGPAGAERGEGKQFRDSEQNHLFEQLERVAGGSDFEKYRGKWIRRVQEFPGIMREAVGDVRLFMANPRNKLRKPAGAMIFRRAQQLARAAGKSFHLW